MTSFDNLTIGIIDDHALFAESLSLALKSKWPDSTVFILNDERESLSFVADKQPDIILLDIKMPNINGTEIIELIRKKYPKNPKVMFLSSIIDPSVVRKMIQAGANGFSSKNVAVTELVVNIERIMNGETVLSEEVKENQKGENIEIIDKLSAREIEVLRLLEKGAATKQIADELFISVHTVATHRQNVMLKLNAANTLEAVNKAVKLGLI